MKNSKGLGVDELDSFSVKIAANIIDEPLHHIIMLSLSSGKFPDKWKYAKIIPLFKKDDKLHKKNYRPVAILSPLSKVLERVYYNQLYSYFNNNKLFNRNHHGYRKNRLTQNLLLQIYDRWIQGAKNSKLNGIILIDLSAAFDLVDPSVLCKKLEIYGLDHNAIQWIKSYMENRFQAVWIQMQ